jgi:hypothetical protein
LTERHVKDRDFGEFLVLNDRMLLDVPEKQRRFSDPGLAEQHDVLGLLVTTAVLVHTIQCSQYPFDMREIDEA